jgi:uncharacterized protein (DUF1800 family)
MARAQEQGGAERIDAAVALGPFRPGADGPWDRAAAAHLLRRAGFGMPEEAIRKALEVEPRAAAEALFQERPEIDDVLFTGAAAYQVASVEAAQNAWVYRLLRGASPAREKLTLFWHGHFATSVRKVEDARLMTDQIELFRARGPGPFVDLLQGVARDPAMLVWLDGNSNRSGTPNENFARELMELFSLGIGNYTEIDIKEAARGFTGWHVRERRFWFNERAHDRGVKKVLGASGSFGGEDIVRLCAERRQCAEFIAGKLFSFYVYPEPEKELRSELGAAYAACGGRTAEFLARLFSSRVFYSARARRAIVAPPADFTAGTLRTLGARAGAAPVARAMAAMGQELLAPPSVKGWDMGQAWLSSGTLLARYRFVQSLTLESANWAGGDLAAAVPWETLGGDARAVTGRFFPEGLPAAVVEDLAASAGGDPKAVVAGCLELPEYQFV